MEKIAHEQTATISISVVSHAQMDMVIKLLRDVEAHCKDSVFEFILTLNLNEPLLFPLSSFTFPIKVLRNATPMGFAANHNQAFSYATGQYFCVMNPDIRLNSNPFNDLLAGLEDSSVGVVAPLVLNEAGEVEDSARRFPHPLNILCKALGGCKRGDYVKKNEPFSPDWAGGMFLLFPRSVFKKLDGFDERYFLYYEDVDICARLRLMGCDVLVCPQAKVTHHAQRSSHHSFKYLRWHVTSMMRFFLSPVYWRLRSRPRS